MRASVSALVLVLALAACNRQPAAKNVSGGPVAAARNDAAPAAPAQSTPANAVADDAASAPEEGDVTAGRDEEAEASAEADEAEGCAGEIGLTAARRLVEQCTEVSTATRPPCNTSNSCAMIRSEIQRSCAILKEDAPGFCE
jgi:hypothetical protein